MCQVRKGGTEAGSECLFVVVVVVMQEDTDNDDGSSWWVGDRELCRRGGR